MLLKQRVTFTLLTDNSGSNWQNSTANKKANSANIFGTKHGISTEVQVNKCN